MQHKDERAWMLQNVIVAAKLPPLTNVYHRDDNGLVHLMKEPTTPQLPTLIGKVHALALTSCAGLPSYLNSITFLGIFRHTAHYITFCNITYHHTTFHHIPSHVLVYFATLYI
jgi:hypothetical protein